MADMKQYRTKELFDYEPDTGRLLWKPRPRSDFKMDHRFRHWNRTYPGVEAGCICPRSGYRVISLCPQNFRAHRIIWAWVHGDIGGHHIDHINGDRSDNRLINLRAVDAADNRRNVALKHTNKSGVHGVRMVESGKWACRITYNYRRIHLGTFSSLEEAIAVRKEFERKLGYHPNHGRIATRPVQSA